MWEPEKLERQLAFMKENKYAFTYSEYYVMEEDGKKRVVLYVYQALYLIVNICGIQLLDV